MSDTMSLTHSDSIPYRITMFSGGTGSNRLTKALLSEWPTAVDLRILINAYDDGKSTGKIRRDFGMLGPSDIGKNLIAAIDPTQPGALELANFLEYSLPKNASPKELWDQFSLIVQGTPGRDPMGLGFLSLPSKWQPLLRVYFAEFKRLADRWSRNHSDEVYDLSDFRVRNLLIVGAVQQHRGDYPAALNQLRHEFGVRAEILLNDVRDVHLAAVTTELELLADEAAIVDGFLNQDIEEVFLLEHRLTKDEIGRFESLTSWDARRAFLRTLSSPVELSSRAAQAIRSADAVVFAPTTLESSLTPTLMSRGCWRALLEARGARIFIANLVRERGLRSLGDQLRHLEKLMRQELGEEYFLHDVIDCVIANSGFRKTGPLGGTRRIPVDRHDVESLGVDLYEQSLEDPKCDGLHDGSKLAESLMQLLGERLEMGSVGRQRKVASNANRNRLMRWMLDPLTQRHEIQRLDRFTVDTLISKGTDVLSGKLRSDQSRQATNPSIATVRVVIAANGRGSRMHGSVPKVLTEIAGKPALQHLVERALEFDSSPVVVTNEANNTLIQKALRQWAPQGTTVCVPPRGSGAAVLAALETLPETVKTLMVLWGDAPNVQSGTMRRTLLAHQALGDRAATLASSWEYDPYAGIERNALGEVAGLFQTKVDPHTRRALGEHDASLFVLDRQIVRSALKRQLQSIEKVDPHAEIDLLQTLHRMPSSGFKLASLAIADVRETQGFNTLEEASKISKLAIELAVESRRSVKPEMVQWSRSRPTISVPEVTLDAMQVRLRSALRPTYHGFAVDVDGNLIDARERLTENGFQRLIDVARRGIPIGLITGRRLDSLDRLLLSPIAAAVGKNDPATLSQFYVYPFNGAVGFRLDRPNDRFYDRPLPRYLSAATMRALRSKVLSSRDSYDVTDYKITIWPADARQQSQLVIAINDWMHRLMIPVQAQVSGSPTFNGAIVMTSTEYGSRAGKNVALNDFLQRISVPLDSVAKVGDQAGPYGVDHELLQGQGSFTTETCDPTCHHQVSLPWVTSKQHLEAFEWLIERLDFAPVASPRVAATNVAVQIKV